MSLSKSLSIISLIVSLISCTASQKASKNIYGTWILKSVVTEGISSSPNSTFFDEANFSCFIGSEWKFNKGRRGSSFMLVDKRKDCPEITRRFTWEYKNSGTPALFFKRLNEQGEAMPNEAGFQYLLTESVASSMKIKQEVSINGQSGALIYNFVRR
jgi:hypothetical protein